MAEMGPGLRREGEDGRIALNHPYASKHQLRGASEQFARSLGSRYGLPLIRQTQLLAC